jgi:hypothetical protein
VVSVAGGTFRGYGCSGRLLSVAARLHCEFLLKSGQ